MSHKIKILLITKYFPPEPGAGATRAYEHAKRWVMLGAGVTVLTCFPHYPDGVIPPKYKGHSYYEEELDGIKIIRTYTYATPNKGKIKRSIGFFSFMISSIIQGYFKFGRQDVIIASSPPITVGVSGLLLSRLRNIRFVFEVRDLWPESIVQLGQIKNKFIIKALEKLEKVLYHKADLIVGISEPFVDFISAKGIEKKKIFIVKNGVDLKLFEPVPDDNNLRERLNLKGKFIVSYFGTFGLSHALDKVLLAAKILLNKNNSIHFLLIGDGEERNKLIKMKDELKLENVTILKTVTKEELKKFYSISDLMLVTLRDLKLFNSALPSKMFEIMAMGKPILHTVDGVMRKMLEENKIGIFAEPENPKALVDAIKNLFSQLNTLKEMGERGRNFVEKYFDRDKLAKEYLNYLMNLNKGNH
jgi:glycosyltransferase involved in cell wall biosynthesis